MEADDALPDEMDPFVGSVPPKGLVVTPPQRGEIVGERIEPDVDDL